MTTVAGPDMDIPTNTNDATSSAEASVVNQNSQEQAGYTGRLFKITPELDTNQSKEFKIKPSTINTLSESLIRCYRFFDKGNNLSDLDKDQKNFYLTLKGQIESSEDPQAIKASVEAYLQDEYQLAYAIALAGWEKNTLQLATGKLVQLPVTAEQRARTPDNVVYYSQTGEPIRENTYTPLEAKFIDSKLRRSARVIDKIFKPIGDKLKHRVPNVSTQQAKQQIAAAQEQHKKREIAYYVSDGKGNIDSSINALSKTQKAYLKDLYIQGQDLLDFSKKPAVEAGINNQLKDITAAQLDFFVSTGGDIAQFDPNTYKIINKDQRDLWSDKITQQIKDKLISTENKTTAQTILGDLEGHINALEKPDENEIKIKTDEKAEIEKKLGIATQKQALETQIQDIDKQIENASIDVEKKTKQLDLNILKIKKQIEINTKIFGTLEESLHKYSEILENSITAPSDKEANNSSNLNLINLIDSTQTKLTEISNKREELELRELDLIKEKDDLKKNVESPDVQKLKEDRAKLKTQNSNLVLEDSDTVETLEVEINEIDKVLQKLTQGDQARQEKVAMYRAFAEQILEPDKYQGIQSRAVYAQQLSDNSTPNLDWDNVPEKYKEIPPVYLRTLQILFGPDITKLTDEQMGRLQKIQTFLPEDKFKQFLKKELKLKKKESNEEYEQPQFISKITPELINKLLNSLFKEVQNHKLGET